MFYGLTKYTVVLFQTVDWACRHAIISNSINVSVTVRYNITAVI